MKKSLDSILGDLKEREKMRERGTWKQAFRQRYAPWFEDLVYGFEVKKGWRPILEEALEGIARAVGGPPGCPDLRVTSLKQERGGLALQIRGLPDERRDAVDAIIRNASERCLRTCEWCGRPGVVRSSAGDKWRTACDTHRVAY